MREPIIASAQEASADEQWPSQEVLTQFCNLCRFTETVSRFARIVYSNVPSDPIDAPGELRTPDLPYFPRQLAARTVFHEMTWILGLTRHPEECGCDPTCWVSSAAQGFLWIKAIAEALVDQWGWQDIYSYLDISEKSSDVEIFNDDSEVNRLVEKIIRNGHGLTVDRFILRAIFEALCLLYADCQGWRAMLGYWPNKHSMVGILDVYEPYEVEKMRFLEKSWAGSFNTQSKKDDALPAPRQRGNGDLENRAMKVVMENPTWTLKEIADHLGCHPGSLSRHRCPRLSNAIAMIRTSGRSLPRGTKDADGNLEAFN